MPGQIFSALPSHDPEGVVVLTLSLRQAMSERGLQSGLHGRRAAQTQGALLREEKIAPRIKGWFTRSISGPGIGRKVMVERDFLLENHHHVPDGRLGALRPDHGTKAGSQNGYSRRTTDAAPRYRCTFHISSCLFRR